MKYLLLAFLIPILSYGQSRVHGVIRDVETKTPLINASIVFKKNEVFKAGTTTNQSGQYSEYLSPGNYDLHISYIGYSDLKLENVKIALSREISLTLELNQITYLCGGLFVTKLYNPFIFWDKESQSNSLWEENIKRFPSKKIEDFIQSIAGLSNYNY